MSVAINRIREVLKYLLAIFIGMAVVGVSISVLDWLTPPDLFAQFAAYLSDVRLSSSFAVISMFAAAWVGLIYELFKVPTPLPVPPSRDLPPLNIKINASAEDFGNIQNLFKELRDTVNETGREFSVFCNQLTSMENSCKRLTVAIRTLPSPETISALQEQMAKKLQPAPKKTGARK